MPKFQTSYFASHRVILLAINRNEICLIIVLRWGVKTKNRFVLALLKNFGPGLG